MEGLDELKELVLHYARGIWRYRWVAVPITWVVLVAGVLFVDQLPNRYRAETKLYIDSSSVLKPLLEGLAIQSDFNAIVQLMVKQLLSRPNVERAIQLVGMDIGNNNPMQMEQLVASVSDRVEVGTDGRTNIYTISYTATDRRQAERMAQVLLDIFIEDALGKSGNESESAIEFLDTQIAKYDALLREAEKKREDFRRENIGLMPNDGATYYTQLQAHKTLLEEANLALAEAENRRDQIVQQITQLQNNQTGQVERVKSSLDLRIEDQERKLDELLLLYTDEHPDVINAKLILKSLRDRKEKELTEDKPAGGVSIGENPVYQELQILLAETEANISSYETRVKSLERKQLELKRLVDIVPQIESELQRLNRDYDVHKNNYNQLVARREKAKITEDVEAGGDQVQFRVIEPPYASLRPSFPNRPLFDLGVLALALGAGYGASLLISLLRPVFYNLSDIRKVLTIPTLGAIKKFDTPRVIGQRRRNLAMFTMVNLLLLGVAGYLIHLHSEDVVLTDFVRRLVI